jgi:hypothetical protein
MKPVVSTSKEPATLGVGTTRATCGSSWTRGHANETEGAFRETRYGWSVLAGVWLVSALYLWLHLKDGWVPHDAGTLAYMADRVLHGQVPYRDFIEVYTGGLTYLNALAFRLFGESLFSLRVPLFLFFLGWVPSVYWIARRFVSPLTAGAVTLLAVAWSVPNYPEAMPSWYNLFFATWGVLALFRYTETERRRWLWIAGICAGLSFLVKIVALYFVGAALLFFVFRELSLSRRASVGPSRGAFAYRIFASTGLLLFLIALTMLVSQRPTGTNFFYFVLPSACLVGLLLREVWRTPSPGNWLRFRCLFSMILPFLGGTAAPIAIFLAFYIRAGALSAWLSGALVASVRFAWSASSPLSSLLAFGLLPMVLTIVLAYHRNGIARRRLDLAAAIMLATTLALSRRFLAVYAGIGLSVPAIVPLREGSRPPRPASPVASGAPLPTALRLSSHSPAFRCSRRGRLARLISAGRPSGLANARGEPRRTDPGASEHT